MDAPYIHRPSASQKLFSCKKSRSPPLETSDSPFNSLDFGVRENLLVTKDLTIESDVTR